MCGIAGMLHLDGKPASPVALKAMTNSIAHRGPDGEGFFIEGFVGIGHRRLAIIDLSPAGHQPMQTRDGRYVIAYNGEIYNFQGIRLELEAKGYQFHSQTDSEVVLNAFAEWGADSLIRFNGMFAFAIWDRKELRMTLARDRYGVKPLYYRAVGSSVFFGSEIKAILEHNDVFAELDAYGLAEYLSFQNFFTDRTLFRDIKILPAGSYLQFELGNARATSVKSQCYWDFDFREPDGVFDEREYLEELDRLFCQSVNRQMVSDVELGAYLSGGMDSGSITAVASSQVPYIKTFTVGFDLAEAAGIERNYDERGPAESLSSIYKTEHYEMVLKAGDMERCMARLAWHLEEPRVGQCYPNFYAAQLASKFVKVCLSGAGGDELFGGYPWRYYRAVVNCDFEDYVAKYYKFWQRLIPARKFQSVIAPVLEQIGGFDPIEIFKGVFAGREAKLETPEDYVNHSLYFEAKTFLHGLFVVEDKMSMAHGLETRVPFLDNDLVDFAMTVPVNLKLGRLRQMVKVDENAPGDKTNNYFSRYHDGKLILRKSMEKFIPREVAERAKQGFSAPDASWFKGESIDYVKRSICNPRAGIYKWLDYSQTQSLLQEHLEGRENRRLLIWSLLSLEHAQKQFGLA